MMKKNVKRIISAMLILMLALQVLPSSAFITNASETTESKEPIYTDAGLMYVYYDDISTYRTDKSYPEEEGYVFGGWWTGITETEKDANAESLLEIADSGSAWAKYVPEDVLTVKAQISQRVADAMANTDENGTLADGNSLKLRLVTSVDDSEKYSEVGFNIKVNNEAPYEAHIYKTLTVREKNNADTVEPNEVFHKTASGEFATFVIGGFNTLEEINATELCVTPYWITLEGTTVYGTARTRLLASDDRASDADGSKTGETNDFAAPENTETQIGTYTYNVTSVSETTSYKYFAGASDTVYLKGQYTPSGENVKFGIAIRNGGLTRQVVFSNAGVLVVNGVDGNDGVNTSGLIGDNAIDKYDDVTNSDADLGAYVWARKATADANVYTATDSAIIDLLGGTSAKTVIWAIENNVLYCNIEGETVLRLPMNLLSKYWQPGRYYQLGVAAYNVENNEASNMSFNMQELTFGKNVYREGKLIEEATGVKTPTQMVYEPITASYKAPSKGVQGFAYGEATTGTQMISTTIKLPTESGDVTSMNGIALKSSNMPNNPAVIRIEGTGNDVKLRIRNHDNHTISIKDWITKAGVTDYFTNGECKLTAGIKDDTLYVFVNDKLVGSVDVYKLFSVWTTGYFVEGTSTVELGAYTSNPSAGQSEFCDLSIITGEEAEAQLAAMLPTLDSAQEWEIFYNENTGRVDGTSKYMTCDGYVHTVTTNATTTHSFAYGIPTTMPQRVTATLAYGTDNATAACGIAVMWGSMNANQAWVYGRSGYDNELRSTKEYATIPLHNANATIEPFNGEALNADKSYDITAIVKDGKIYIKYNDQVQFEYELTGWTEGQPVCLGLYSRRSYDTVEPNFTNVNFDAGADIAVEKTQAMSNLSNMSYNKYTEAYRTLNTSGLAYASGTAYAGTQMMSTTIALPKGSDSITSSSGIYVKSGDMMTPILIQGTGGDVVIKINNSDTHKISVKDWIGEVGISEYYKDGACKVTAGVMDDTLYLFINDQLAGSVDLYKLLSLSDVGYYIEGSSTVELGICAVDPNGGQTIFHDVSATTGEDAEATLTSMLKNVDDKHEWEIFVNADNAINGTGIGNNMSGNGYVHAVETIPTKLASCHTYGVATTMSQKVSATYSFSDTQVSDGGFGNGIIVRWGPYSYLYGINANEMEFRRAVAFNWTTVDTSETIPSQVYQENDGQYTYNITGIVKDGWVYIKYNDTVQFKYQMEGWSEGMAVRLGIYSRTDADSKVEFTNVNFEAGADVNVDSSQLVSNLSNMSYDKATGTYTPNNTSGLAYAYASAYTGAQVVSTTIELPTENGSITSSNGIYLRLSDAVYSAILIEGSGNDVVIKVRNNDEHKISIKNWIANAGINEYFIDGKCELTAGIKDETLYLFINGKLAGSVDLYKLLSVTGMGYYEEGSSPVALGICSSNPAGGQVTFGDLSYRVGTDAEEFVESKLTGLDNHYEWEIFVGDQYINGMGTNMSGNGYEHSVTQIIGNSRDCYVYGATTTMPQKLTAKLAFGDIKKGSLTSTNGFVVAVGGQIYTYGIFGHEQTFKSDTDININGGTTVTFTGTAYNTDLSYDVTAVVKDGWIYMKYNEAVMFKDQLEGWTEGAQVRLGLYTRRADNFTSYYTNVNFEAGTEVKVPSSNIDLANKNISILGDSISTYEGVSNNAEANSTIGNNAVYYTSKLLQQSETYWGQIIDKYDMNLLVNNSYSGGRIVEKRANIPSGLARCVQLHDDTGNNAGTNPDIIAVYMGTNDLTNKIALDEFATAYDEMLSAIKTTYPNADVFCFTLLPSDNNTAALLSDYNAQIKASAQSHGFSVVDIASQSGITRYNYKEYLDGSHPYAPGMKLIADVFEDALVAKYGTFTTF